MARESGAVVDLGDGVVLRLVSGSRLRPRPAVSLPLGGAARTRTHSFVLESGSFQNEGGTLRAVVAAPSGAGPGPWVLRVQVNDQFGSAIGRDFVEIDRCAPKAAPRPKTAASKAPSQG